MQLIQTSIKLGFLTGEESQIMLDAHCQVPPTKKWGKKTS